MLQDAAAVQPQRCAVQSLHRHSPAPWTGSFTASIENSAMQPGSVLSSRPWHSPGSGRHGPTAVTRQHRAGGSRCGGAGTSSTRALLLGPLPLGMEVAAAPEGAVRGSGAWREPAEPITEQELREELQRARDDYNIATGTISSLQRQLEIKESQLQRARSETEMLQKQLRKQESQLQDMSNQFCSLREQKCEETMVTIAEENCSLRQVITEQESKLAVQNKLISELQETISQLQTEACTNRYHIRKQQQQQEAAQREVKTLQQRELQTRVALELVTSKFEKYRNKIIQATFSTAGIKPPQAETTDEEVLEAMQKIINERIEFHQMLKQKGVRVPPLYGTDTAASPTSKGRRRSSARQQHTTPEKQP
ncbi:coiled-coil domain-containing protein 27 [Ara ararauna]